MLSQLQLGGKQVFLLTNSLYDYTDTVMTFLLGAEWIDYFDLVICGARKPGFLLDPYLPLFQVRLDDCSLTNIEVGGSQQQAAALLGQGKVFQGGNWNHLHKLLNLQSGADLMYVGDHMYSDILRSKRTLGWRTMLVIPELADELHQAQLAEEMQLRIHDLQATRADLDARLQFACMRKLTLLQEPGSSASDVQECEDELSEIRAEQKSSSAKLRAAIQQHHEAFHPVWGRIFKAGHQNSRWAQQVENYACLYTARAVNLAFVTPEASFRVLTDMMPHDRAGGISPAPADVDESA